MEDEREQARLEGKTSIRIDGKELIEMIRSFTGPVEDLDQPSYPILHDGRYFHVFDSVRVLEDEETVEIVLDRFSFPEDISFEDGASDVQDDEMVDRLDSLMKREFSTVISKEAIRSIISNENISGEDQFRSWIEENLPGQPSF